MAAVDIGTSLGDHLSSSSSSSSSSSLLHWWDRCSDGRHWVRNMLGLSALASLACYAYIFWPSLGQPPCWGFPDCRPSLLRGGKATIALAPMQLQPQPPQPPQLHYYPTSLDNIVFGIAATAAEWQTRKEYVKLWWRPGMRGYTWLDRLPIDSTMVEWNASLLPPWRISEPTASRFEYSWPGGNPSAIRVARIISETFRLGLPNVHWFVMGDDDTVFFPDNLIKVLSKYNHNLPYYIGYHSESHEQNVIHSYSMAFGGGGYAISYPLAKALEKTQDRCLHRYPHLYGSDSRMAACFTELGVPLTQEPGFHQIDLRGSIFGILAAHPLTPLLSLHHIDAVDPIFPDKDRVESLRHLMKAVNVDPYGILQQSICYDKSNNLSISVSTGFAVQIYWSILPAIELQKPVATFLDWKHWSKDNRMFAFDIRPYPKDDCAWNVFFMDTVKQRAHNFSVTTFSKYDRKCGKHKSLDRIRVHQKIESLPWLQAPTRQCCEVVHSFFEGKTMEIKVRRCREGEVISAG